MKEKFEHFHTTISKKIFFENLEYAENFLKDQKFGTQIFQTNDGKFFIQLDENQIEIFFQHQINELVFENSRKFFDYIGDFLNQKNKPLGFFGNLEFEREYFEQKDFEKIVLRLKNGIGFLFEDDFELENANPNKTQIGKTYQVLKKIFGEYFFVFVVNTGLFSSHQTKNIILVPKYVRYYTSDFSKYLKYKSQPVED